MRFLGIIGLSVAVCANGFCAAQDCFSDFSQDREVYRGRSSFPPLSLSAGAGAAYRERQAEAASAQARGRRVESDQQEEPEDVSDISIDEEQRAPGEAISQLSRPTDPLSSAVARENLAFFQTVLGHAPCAKVDLTPHYDGVVSLAIRVQRGIEGDARRLIAEGPEEEEGDRTERREGKAVVVLEFYNPHTKKVDQEAYTIVSGEKLGTLSYHKSLLEVKPPYEDPGYKLKILPVIEVLEKVRNKTIKIEKSWPTRSFYIQQLKIICEQSAASGVWYVDHPIHPDLVGVDFYDLDRNEIPKKFRPTYDTEAGYIARLLKTYLYIEGFDKSPFRKHPTVENLLAVLPGTKSSLEDNVYADRAGNVNLGLVATSVYGLYRWAHDKTYGGDRS